MTRKSVCFETIDEARFHAGLLVQEACKELDIGDRARYRCKAVNLALGGSKKI